MLMHFPTRVCFSVGFCHGLFLGHHDLSACIKCLLQCARLAGWTAALALLE